MEVRCILLPKWNNTGRHHPRGISVMDKGEVLEPSETSASHKLGTQVYIWNFTVVPQSLKQRGEGSAGKPQYPLLIAGAV